MTSLDFINRANAEYVEALYEQFRRDPESVDDTWALFFAGFDAARGSNGVQPAQTSTLLAMRPSQHIGVFDLVHSYRELGHLIADLDPLGHNQLSHPLLEPSEFGFAEGDLTRIVDAPPLAG